MPLGAPIGTNKGLTTRDQLQIIIENSNVPVIIGDAGLGAPSHASEAMELGADAVLVNTAIATATDPIAMATAAFKMAVESGRLAFESGLPPAASCCSCILALNWLFKLMYSNQFDFKYILNRAEVIPASTDQSIDQLLATPDAIFGVLSDSQLEALAQRAAFITQQRFGHVMRFLCHCTYPMNVTTIARIVGLVTIVILSGIL